MNARAIFPPSLAERFKDSSGKSYRPSNGTEGEYFEDAYCRQCNRGKDDAPPCPIAGLVLWLDVTDERYPKEWVYGDDGQPKCTAFEPISE